MEFISSSEMKCQKSIYLDWVGWDGQSSFEWNSVICNANSFSFGNCGDGDSSHGSTAVAVTVTSSSQHSSLSTF